MIDPSSQVTKRSAYIYISEEGGVSLGGMISCSTHAPVECPMGPIKILP